MKHTLGKFDSWEIVREDVAKKTCDKSFYEHNGSGIPQNIRWFFAAEELEPGAKKSITIQYGGSDYSGNVQRGSDELARTRLFWDATLTSHFKVFSNDGKPHVAEFHRMDEDRYEMIFFSEDGWWPSLSEYDPGITAAEYEEILRNGYSNNIRTLAALFYLHKMGGEGTCTEIAERYGGKASNYRGQTNGVMQYVAKASGCPVLPHDDGEGKQYVPVLFYGKNQSADGQGIYRWKLREPLEEAIRSMEESGFFAELEIEENIMSDFSRNMILYGPPGTGKTYYSVIYAVAICEGKSLDEVKAEDYNDVLARFNELKKKGQVLFTTFHQSYGYEEFIEGIRPVMDNEENHGRIHYEISEGIFKKICTAASTPEGPEIDHKAKIWGVRLRDGSLNDLKQECFDNDVIRFDGPETVEHPFEWTYERLCRMAPGDYVVSYGGSSYFTDGIGIVEEGEPYYDDTVSTYRWTRKVKWLLKRVSIDTRAINENCCLPNYGASELKHIKVSSILGLLEEHGVANYEENRKPYVLIIDEINRGNISKIFGELITLIEETKRSGAEEAMEAVLPYSGETFSVPDNVYLLGTMNTADRSIALMDTALRRRFEFREMMPDPSILNAMGVGAIIANGETINVAKMLDVINQRIEFLFDREHTIGHAFFTKLKEDPSLETLGKIFEEKVIPLLQEYFYEDYEKIQLVLGDNDKEDEYKFILDQGFQMREVFKGNPDVDLPEKKYIIQHEAFYKVESYKHIGKDI